MGYTISNSTAHPLTNKYFSDTNTDYVYKAKIKVFKNDLGGILVIKKIAPKEHRVVFTTELGNTIFDFSFEGDAFKVNRILKEMDRKILLNILEKDFKALVQEQIPVANNYTYNNDTIVTANIYGKAHFYTFKKEQLTRITRVGGQKEKVVFLFSEISNNIARHILITHNNIKLQIELKAF